MEDKPREPVTTEELMARTKFRNGADGSDRTTDVDAAFWKHYDGLRPEQRGDLAAMERAGFEAKLRLASERVISGEMRTAERNFLAAGGSPDEWRKAAPKVREEILHKAAMNRRDDNARRVRQMVYS